MKICIFERSNQKSHFSKTKIYFHKKTTPQLLKHIGLQNMKVGVKTNLGDLPLFVWCMLTLALNTVNGLNLGVTCRHGLQLTTDNNLQETDTYRQITGRVFLQFDTTQSHCHQDSYPTSASSMQYDRQLIRREQVPWPCFFKEQLQRRLHPT